MLVENWRKAHGMACNVLAALTAMLATAEQYLPELHQYLPDGWVKWAALAIIVARMVKQPSLHTDAAK